MPDLSIMIKPVSSACNLRCSYCFYEDVAEHRERHSMGRMSYDTLEKLVRRAMRYADKKVAFSIQGGEPTLAGAEFFEKLTEFQKQYNSRGLRVENAVQTNGYELSEELLEIFKREHFLVGVSFDGLPELHDKLRLDPRGNQTSEKVLRNIKQLQKWEIPFNILCVVNHYVAQYPEKVFENLSAYEYLQYIPCIDGFDGKSRDYSLRVSEYAEFLKKSFDKYYEAVQKRKFVSIRNFDNYIGMLKGRQPESCGMSGHCAAYYLIEADGGVYPCDFYVLDEWHMGNINEDSFFKLEKSETAKRFRQISLSCHEKCRQCKWFGLCRGGCRRDREPLYNGCLGLNKWCESYQEFFAYSYERMVRIAEGI